MANGKPGRRPDTNYDKALGLGEVHVGAEYDAAETEFLKAVDEFKRRRGVRFPTNTQLLRVLLSLGYRKCDCGRTTEATGDTERTPP